MKKIQRLIMFVCMFTIVGLGQAFGQAPNIVCPIDITISSDADYTDTGITGVAEAFDISGAVDVEFTDIIINLDINNEGFVRRRWNVVNRADIFCDQTINVGTTQLNCEENVVASITSSSTNTFFVKVFADSLASTYPQNGSLQASRNGVFYDDFITFDCCDIGTNTFYVKSEDSNGNVEVCTGFITVEDKLAPTLINTFPIHLALYGESSVELTLDMLSNHIFDECDVISATFSQSQFNAIGNYDVACILSDASGNTTEGTISVIVTSVNSIVCNNDVNVSLDNEGKAEITPDMILEGQIYANGNYTLSVNGGLFSQKVVLTCNNQNIDNQITIQDANGNQCWANVNIEDKLAPILTIPYEVHLALDASSEAVLTTEKLDKFTFENCNIESKILSQSIFTSAGTYNVTYTVTDDAGLVTVKDFLVTVFSNYTPACYSTTTITLDDDGTKVIDYLNFGHGSYMYDNITVGIGESPNVATEFYDEIMLDCSHVGQTLTLAFRDEPTGNYCWGNLTVLDKETPIAYAQSVISASMNGAEPFVLEPGDIDLGSFDNCGGDVSMIVSPNTFYAPGTYSVKLRVYDESGNSDFAMSTLIVEQGDGIPLECIGIVTVLTDPFGPTTLWAIDFVINSDEFDSFTMSTNPNGPYTEFINFDCTQYDLSSPFDIYVLGLNDGVLSSCTVNLTLLDNTPPIAVVDQGVILELVNGQATLTPAMADDGSYDNCGVVSLSLSQTLFTTAHLGENQVILTVTDESGNTNQGLLIVTVVDNNNGNGCTLNYIIFPADINITDASGELENLSVENLQSIYNYTYAQVHPYTVSQCEDIAYAYEDLILNTVNGYKVLRTFTALDWLTNSVITKVQVIKLFTSTSNVLACNDLVNVNLVNGSAQLFPEDLLEGGNYNFATITLSIQDENGNSIPDNIITQNHIGQTLTYTVTDTLSGNTCSGTINVSDSQGGCPMNIDTDVTFPLDVIYLSNSNIDANQYSPENLVANYGFEQSDVDVSIHPVAPCTLIGNTYEDDVFNYTDGNYKIVRTFTVIDWYTYDPPSTEGIYTHVQTINVGINPYDLICDVLPNSAPAGDCDTGHTLEDDVEWPSDLSVADYRITPVGLIEFSNVPEEDARPIFFNTPDDYTATYVDLLVELTQSTLTVARVWKAVNSTYDLTWHYSQTIVVDFSGFENLVSVNTATDRAVPGVLFNNSTSTNMEGEAQVLGDIITIDFEDEVLNGVNVRDLILIQRHILGLEFFDERLTEAADVNSDGSIKASDILKLRKRILGVTDEIEWKFVDTQIGNVSQLQPKASYIAYKKGDIDDSALLPGDDELPITSKLTIEDKVLNDGETYLIPVTLEDQDLLFGMEIRLGIDTTLLKIKGIENNLEFEMEDYFISPDGELVIIVNDFLNAQDPSMDANNAVVYIQCTAEANILLHDAIKVTNRKSYAVDENLDLYVVGGEIENVITDTNSPELASLSVFPNPTTDYLRIDQSDVSVKGDLNISILNTQGQLIINQTSDIVNVQNLSQGMYYYKITIGEYEKKGKFIVVR
ncbi:MAG: hypothetical protein ACJATI_000151 [Halioglobus sp.]|jgi:hypothetical protein